MRHLFIALLAGLCSTLALGQASEPIVIKFSHVVAPHTPKGGASLKFKELAEARANGRVKVEVYPNSQLYKDGEELEALQLGAVQMLAPSLSKFGPLGAREFEVFDLPYIFPNKDALYRVMDGTIGQGLFKKLENKGIKGLAYWDNGFKNFSANRPLRKVEDFKGLKMRIQSSKVLDAQIRALGAIPQAMAFSEVYQALQTGVVDGTENTHSNTYSQKMHEVQKHLTVSDHGYIGYAVVVNKKFWEGLPPDIRTILEEAMRDATKFERDSAQKDNDQALEAIRASKRTEIYVLPQADRAQWKQTLQAVYPQFESTIGKDLIDAVIKVSAEGAK
jgi:C4-dicarboxylate-binding protein DctP